MATGPSDIRSAGASGTYSERERRAMAMALTLASRARSRARPNPGVGCVLLRDGEVVSAGTSERAGGRHAEIVALQAAGGLADGATAVVTLEPCNHVGRTGPCSEALIEAGVSRVIAAIRDPGRLAGGGVERLREAGVEVQVGLFDAWAREVHRVFLVGAAAGRPHLTLKLARTRDGALAMQQRRWVTGPIARRHVHRLRAEVDAVVVGVGTVLADDPALDVRDVAVSLRQPRPVVLDSHLRTPPEARVVAAGALVVAAEGRDEAAAAGLRSGGARVLTVAAGRDGRLDLAAAMTALFENDITSVLAEPGPALQASLMAQRLVDDVLVHAAPDVADAADLPTVPDTLAFPLEYDVRRIRLLGDDLEVHVRPGHPPAG